MAHRTESTQHSDLRLKLMGFLGGDDGDGEMSFDWRYGVVGAGLLGVTIFYFHVGHVIDYDIIRPNVAREAREYADKVGKPMINVGCGETDWGDVNVDILPRNVKGFMQLDVSKPMPFHNKEFGSLLASHILEHLDNPDDALAEWHRIADKVFVLVPSLWNAWSWLTPEHKWVFLGVPQPRIRIPFR